MVIQDENDESDRPIPYIVDFSPTGLMNIGWSDRMNPPKVLDDIPPALVAIQIPDDDSRRQLNSVSYDEVIFVAKDGSI